MTKAKAQPLASSQQNFKTGEPVTPCTAQRSTRADLVFTADEQSSATKHMRLAEPCHSVPKCGEYPCAYPMRKQKNLKNWDTPVSCKIRRHSCKPQTKWWYLLVKSWNMYASTNTSITNFHPYLSHKTSFPSGSTPHMHEVLHSPLTKRRADNLSLTTTPQARKQDRLIRCQGSPSASVHRQVKDFQSKQIHATACTGILKPKEIET